MEGDRPRAATDPISGSHSSNSRRRSNININSSNNSTTDRSYTRRSSSSSSSSSSNIRTLLDGLSSRVPIAQLSHGISHRCRRPHVSRNSPTGDSRIFIQAGGNSNSRKVILFKATIEILSSNECRIKTMGKGNTTRTRSSNSSSGGRETLDPIQH
jgi:hypothetical protein